MTIKDLSRFVILACLRMWLFSGCGFSCWLELPDFFFQNIGRDEEKE